MIKMGYNVSLPRSQWVTMYHKPPSPITKKRWTNPRDRWLANHKQKMEKISMWRDWLRNHSVKTGLELSSLSDDVCGLFKTNQHWSLWIISKVEEDWAFLNSFLWGQPYTDLRQFYTKAKDTAGISLSILSENISILKELAIKRIIHHSLVGFIQEFQDGKKISVRHRANKCSWREPCSSQLMKMMECHLGDRHLVAEGVRAEDDLEMSVTGHP